MRVEVRTDRCIGAAVCVGIAPEVFELDREENKARVIDPYAGSRAQLEYAAENCPAQAILIELDEGE
jgi:ferredoxin